MLMARRISEVILAVVQSQGRERMTYEISKDTLAKLSEDALTVAEYLCVPRAD